MSMTGVRKIFANLYQCRPHFPLCASPTASCMMDTTSTCSVWTSPTSKVHRNAPPLITAMYSHVQPTLDPPNMIGVMCRHTGSMWGGRSCVLFDKQCWIWQICQKGVEQCLGMLSFILIVSHRWWLGDLEIRQRLCIHPSVYHTSLLPLYFVYIVYQCHIAVQGHFPHQYLIWHWLCHHSDLCNLHN